MPDVIAAKIKINGSNDESTVSGSSKGVDVLKDLLKEFKGLNALFSKAFKLSSAGLGGGLGGGKGAMSIGAPIGNAAKSLLSGGLGAVLGTVGGLASLFGIAKDVASDIVKDQSRLEFDKVLTTEGEERVSVLDNKTGEILKLLTMEEAKEMGIVNSKGKIIDRLDKQDGILDKINGEQDKYLDFIYLGNITADSINKESALHLQVLKDINAAELEKLEKLKGDKSEATISAEQQTVSPFVEEFGLKQSSDYRPMSQPSQDYRSPFEKLLNGQSSEAALNRVSQQDAVRDTFQEQNLLQFPMSFIDLGIFKR